MTRAARPAAFARAVAVAVALAAAHPTVGAAEGTVVKVGWWTANPLAEAPAGGVAVQRAPHGDDVTVAALRVRPPGARLESAVLVLPEAGGVRADAAVLQVCVTDEDFDAVAKGDLADAPAARCDDGAVPVTRHATGAFWTADVLPLLDGNRAVSFVLLSAAGGDVPAGFEVRFQGPRFEATTTPGADAGAGSPGTGGGHGGTGTTTAGPGPVPGGAGPQGLGMPFASPAGDGFDGFDAGTAGRAAGEAVEDLVVVGEPVTGGRLSRGVGDGEQGTSVALLAVYALAAVVTGAAAGLVRNRARTVDVVGLARAVRLGGRR